MTQLLWRGGGQVGVLVFLRHCGFPLIWIIEDQIMNNQ